MFTHVHGCALYLYAIQSEERLDYFVDCLHHETKDQLFLIGGTNRYYKVNKMLRALWFEDILMPLEFSKEKIRRVVPGWVYFMKPIQNILPYFYAVLVEICQRYITNVVL